MWQWQEPCQCGAEHGLRMQAHAGSSGADRAPASSDAAAPPELESLAWQVRCADCKQRGAQHPGLMHAWLVTLAASDLFSNGAKEAVLVEQARERYRETPQCIWRLLNCQSHMSTW